MMKTRRKSKAAAAAAAEAAVVQETSTRENSPALANATITVLVPEDLDSNALSQLLPDINLFSPSPDAILSMYRLIVGHASESDATQRELEDARAEIERKDIELDQALQDRESSTAELESSLESVRKELEHVKQEKEELAVSRATLQAQITTLSTTQSASSTEVDTLKHRVEDTEREKRDLITVVSRLKEDGVQREEEIQTLRANLKQARHEHQALESQLRELRSTENSTKFKLDSLSQQLQLAKEEAARASEELTAKTEDFAKYRRTKHAEFAQLQASHDSLIQTHAATESQLKALQSAHTAQTHQLTQALARVQDLTGQLAEQEATYSSEAAGLRRLIEMMEAREAQAKAIVDGIEKEWAGVGDRAERREAVLKEEIENQRQRAEEAEKRIEELESVLDRMDRGEFPIPFAASASVPGTPARGPATPSMNGTPDILTQGMMGLSPTVAIASRAQRSGKTFTEVYADYVRLQEDYAKKSAEYDHMDRTLSAVLTQIEERAPILSQQRAEYERLQSEASQLASQLAQALSERDALASAAEESAQKFAKSTRENDLLQKQLDDLGRQVQVLLRQVGRIQDPSIPSDEDLEQDERTKPADNIEAVITNNLVLFRSIPQLQEQNQRLLKIVRELGSKMESEEKEYRDALEREQGEAVKEAHEAIKQLQGQLESLKKSSEVTIQAYMKERDSLRSMLAREHSTSRLPTGVNGDINGRAGRPPPQPDLEKELADIQNQFEAYRTEMGVDSVRLREEVVAAQREANQLQATLAKANAKIEFLNDRHRMIQEQSLMQGHELDNLTKRNQQLYDQYTRIDIECNRITEELMTANGLVEQLRNECANLRAEKRIWESVQSRLLDENKALSMERSHLSNLMSNVQKMHNDLERSGENDRRRLETQIQMLENQTQDLRSQLSQERDSLRHLNLQKDIEAKEMQARIDNTAQALAKTRESLVGAETSKRHLEERVEHLTRQLQGNEEKLAVYERRATGVNGITPHTDENMTREQQLEGEVAELRSALKVAEVDLTAARGHVQQFQEISQANEIALATLNVTHDEYKTSTEAELARHESEYDALQERLQAVQQELTEATEKNSESQRLLETERAAWANDRRTLEDTIVDMSTSERNTEDDRASRENEIRQQEERAKAAEERYAHEVLAHAESIKSVEDLRQQLSKTQSAARDYLTASETARAKLTTSEVSWKQQKDALDKEIADLNTRCRDLAAQNNLLHQHLESVSSQAARIKQAADSSSASVFGELDLADDADTKLAELRSVVAYLRREKEIVELQLELSKQENTRLKTQIEHITQNLDETRRALSEERERAVEAAASEAQHAELVERINQLTILRESNATLRADCEAHARRARELDVKLKQVSTELDPAKEELRVARAELEAKEQQVRRLEEESQRWKERNSQLLSKYDRIDPAEVQSLKDEIEQLKSFKSEVERAVAERDEQIKSQTERIAALDANNKHLKEIGQKNNQNARNRFAQLNSEKAQLNETIIQLQTQLQIATGERDELKAQPPTDTSVSSSKEQELSQQLESVLAEKAALEKLLADEKTAHAGAPPAEVEELNTTITALRDERDRLLVEKASWPTSQATSSDLSETQQKWESQRAELVKARDEAEAEAKDSKAKAQKAIEESKGVHFANEKLQARLQDILKAKAAESERAAAQQEAAVTAAVEKLRNELQSTASSPLSDELVNRHAQELRQLEERLTAQHQGELKAAVEAATAAWKESSTDTNFGSGGGQETVIATAIAAHEEKMKEQREQEIAAAVERGRMEQAVKSKVKDAQLVRTQNKLKELEAQILGWRQAGLVPEQSAGASLASSAVKTAGATSSAVTTAKPAATAAVTNAQKGLPRKPSMAQPAPSAEGTGRGRGATRGGIRGTAQGLAIRGTAATGRGGAPAALSAVTSVGDTASGGVSIIGAAGKRTREEGETAPDDSLAKRLKPAEGGSKPVTLRRDRVPPPS
ncbi:hypothetical protein AcW1_007790 [Taiwanofungus camphoratus]|nr:hypothetical protein AcW1_007790 [Antrodia cinnamomea]